MSVLERALAKAKMAGSQSATSALQLGRVREPRPATPVPSGSLEAPMAAPEVRPAEHIEIYRDALRQAGLLAPESQEWRILEEYRQRVQQFRQETQDVFLHVDSQSHLRYFP